MNLAHFVEGEIEISFTDECASAHHLDAALPSGKAPVGATADLMVALKKPGAGTLLIEVKDPGAHGSMAKGQDKEAAALIRRGEYFRTKLLPKLLPTLANLAHDGADMNPPIRLICLLGFDLLDPKPRRELFMQLEEEIRACLEPVEIGMSGQRVDLEVLGIEELNQRWGLFVQAKRASQTA